jgi:hypothetical protein
MARYKKYLTNQQKKKLRSLYAGYQQTTADERREAYLQARRAADRSAAAASSMGLGGGYEARKQAAADAEIDKYGLQLNRQADAAFESNAVVPMANQTIKAQNEAARKAYERKKRAAQRAYQDALNKQAQQQTARLTKQERDRLKYYRYGQQYMDDALMPDNAAYQSAPKTTPKTTQTTNPRYNAHNRDKAYQYAQEWVDDAGATRPKTKRERDRAKANRYAQDWAGNAPKESPLKKNNGSAVNPRFDISPKRPVVLPPEYAKEVEARVKDIKPGDVPQVKLDYLNEVNQYANLLQGLNEAYKPVGKMQDLANQYQQLVRDISDPTLSVAQRKQASVLAQQLEQDYREAYNSFSANKAGLQYLQNRVERAYGTLQIDRAVLSRLGVEMTEDDIGFNTGWAKTHGYIPETPEELFIATRDLIDNENEKTDEFWKRAKNNSAVLFGYGDESGNYKNALGESTIPEEERKLVLDSQDETWMRENGFGWVIDGVAQMLENSNQYATFAQAAKAFLEQKEADEWQYFEERNVRRVLNRFNEIDDSEKDTVMSEGAKQTGIDLDRWDDIHAAWEGVSNYKFETDENGQVRAVWKKTGNVLKDNALNRNAGNYVGGNIAAGQIEKKLGLPSRYLNTNTLAIMTKEDAAFINYCYGMGDKETARQYIYQLAELANQLVGKEKADKIAELPWGIRFARESMDQFSYGVSSFHTGLADVFTNHRTPTTVKEVKSSAITENQRERGWGGAADVINPALVSAGNMAPSIALGYAGGAAAAALSNTAAGASTLGVLATEGLSHAGTISMGLSAGGKAKQEALRMGYGKDAANVYGIINGISETCLQDLMGGVVTLGQPQWLEALGDSLLNSVKNPVARVMVRQALNAASETTEEVMQDILDPVFKGVSLNEKYLNDHPDAKQLLNTALSTVVSTLLMNGLGGDILNTAKTETAVQRLSESYGLSVADARFMLNTYSTLMSKKGGDLDIEDYSKFNELAAVIESNLPSDVIDKIQKGETDLISYGASQYGAVSGKLDRNIAKFSEGKQAETLDATDHTAELSNLKGKAKARYLIDASPTGKVGSLYFTTTDGKTMDVKNMSLTQKANFNIAQKLAKAFPNIKIVAHDNLYGIDGVNHVVEGQAPEIHVSLNGSAMVMTTAAHELLHQVEKTDAKAYKNIQSYLTTLLDESEVATTEKNVASKYGIEYTVDKNGNKVFKDAKAQKTFESEVAAHLVEKVLTDDSFLDRIIRDSDPKNQTARAKLINGLKDVIDRVTKALRGEPTVSGKLYKLQRTIEKAYRDMSKADLTATETETEEADFEAVEKNEKQKEEVVKEATEKVEEMPTIEEASTEEIEKNPGISFLGNRDTLGKTMDKNMEPMFRVSDWNADEDAYREMATRFNLFGSKAEADKFFNMMRRVADNIALQTEKGVKSLDYSITEDESMSDFHPEDWYDGDERTYSPVKPNSDPLYKWSIDFSTLCRKRLLQQAVQKRLETQLKRNLSVDEQIAIRNALKNLQKEGKKIEVACALCYVEAARFRSPKQISRFMSDRQGFLLKQIQDKALADEFKAVREEVKEKYGVSDMKALRKNAKAKAEFTDRINELRDNYKPTAKEQALLDAVNDYDVTDFTTPAGLEKLARENRELYDAYTTFIRQATKSKALETSTPWRAGDSEKISDAEFEAFNSENGLRSNSWSDFQVMHLLDYISSIIELSTRNAKMQAYTKVANYARLMGDTGVMINLSLIPTAKYTKGSKMDSVSDYDSVEGMDYTLALQLRKEHANTVGTICIATNDEQLAALCANPNVDMVIPYHDSGMSKANRKKMGIPDWQSYQKVQSEKEVALPKEAQTKDYHKPIKFSDWFDYDEAAKTAKDKGAFAAMEEAARKYLDLCKERGYTPKFADYTKVKGYWKLLTDRKMINQETGEIIKQEAVKPIFDEGTINDIIKEEVDNYAELSKDFDEASDAVFEQFKDGNFKTTAEDKRLADTMNNALVSAVMGDDMMRLSDSDTEYLSLAEKYRDGTATEDEKAELEKRVEEAARKAGYTIKAYHGTPFINTETNPRYVDAVKALYNIVTGKAMPDPGDYGTKSHHDFWGFVAWASQPRIYRKIVEKYAIPANVAHLFKEGPTRQFTKFDAGRFGTSAASRESLKGFYFTPDKSAAQIFRNKYEIDQWSETIRKVNVGNGFVYSVYLNPKDITSRTTHNGKQKFEEIVVTNASQIKSADPVTYDDNGDIIPLSERFRTDREGDEAWKNEDIRYRYSDVDAEYMKAVEDGDEATQARIIEEAAKKAFPKSVLIQDGVFRKMWHHTNKEFTSFLPGTSPSSGGLKGIYFTPQETSTMSALGNVHKAYYLDVENMKFAFGVEADRKYADQLRELQKGVTDREQLAEINRKFREETGIDAFFDWQNGWYNVLAPELIKSADLITRDDDGNIIPPSKRFDINDEDIRYRISDYTEDETIVGTPIDAAAVRRAVKTGKSQKTKDGYSIKVSQGEDNKYTVTVSRDGEVINTREGVANEELKGADIERTAAALMRNIKKGRANSNNTSTSDIYIDKGENPARDVNVPKSARQGMKTSKLARTIAEAPGMTEESVEELMNKVYRGFMSYQPDVNKESMDKALKKIEDNMAGAVVEWNQIANSGRILTPDDIALGSALMVSASQSGDINSAMETASQLQDLATTGGKLVQSFRMIKRLGAAGAFYYINRQVAKINAELEKQAKGYKLTLNEELVQNLLNAKDYHDIREATEALRKDLGQQLKPTLKDWLTAWRYTAMLGNAKTLVRNDIGNAAYVPVVMMDNVLNAIGQTVTSAASKGKFEKTTKLFAGKEYRDFANWDWKDTVKYDIKGNKYSEGQLGDIKDYMRYDTGAKGVLKPAAKAFDWWRSTTQKFMEDEAKLGDMAFKKLHYQHALATRLDQLKVDVKALQDVLVRSRNNESFESGTKEAKLLAAYEAATQYAVSEANRNTYNDINAFASFVSQMSRTMYEKQNKNGRHTLRAGHYALEGLLPFKNTPANIVARAAEHSPIGLAKTLTLDLGKVIKGAIAEQQFAKGKISKQKYENLIASSISGEQFIHNLSSGLTGSALFALGAILAKAGLLHGGLGYDDPEDKEKKRRGHQSYSLEIGNVSITLDWLAPECIPLFMGVELFEQLSNMTAEEWNKKWLKALLNVTTGAFEPMLNMSMLSGINALFEGFTSSDDLQGIGKVAATVATSYLTQFQPTILGQFARTIDPTRRTTYYDKNAKIPPFMQKFWQTALKKIPGATFLLQPYVDEFGNTSKTFEKYGSGALWLNMAEQFFSPAYRSKLSNTEVDQEIERLGEDAYPSRANKYINFDKQKYNLSADEYTAYATLRGETAYALVQNMIGTDAYNALSDAEKVAAFKDAYTYADTIAKSTILGMRGVIGADPGALESWVGKANEYAKAVGTLDAISQFIAVKQGLKANGITNRDDRAQFLWQQDIPAENKALLMEMNDGSNGGYADGTAFYNKKGELIVDFGGERPAIDTAPTAESEAAAEVPSSAEVPAVEDKYVEATNTVKKMNAEESAAYLNTTSFTAEEKYQILANADKNDPRAKNAQAFHTTYGLSYDDMWDVHSKYNSESFHGYDFHKYVDGKKGLKGRQKFALVELANTQSAWLEKAQNINSKMGISYDTLWKIKLYWSGESGQGKKARITAYCKSLGLKQSQIDKLYNEYKFLS